MVYLSVGKQQSAAVYPPIDGRNSSTYRLILTGSGLGTGTLIGQLGTWIGFCTGSGLGIRISVVFPVLIYSSFVRVKVVGIVGPPYSRATSKYGVPSIISTPVMVANWARLASSPWWIS